LNMLVIFC